MKTFQYLRSAWYIFNLICIAVFFSFSVSETIELKRQIILIICTVVISCFLLDDIDNTSMENLKR